LSDTKEVGIGFALDLPRVFSQIRGNTDICEVVINGVILIGVFLGLWVFALVYTLASRKL
jgi:hypothetical protein